jgi:HAD superfamily hydrolase (TIGR01509 family)
MIKAIIFDFDGTILETEGPVYQSWLEVYQSFGYNLELSDWIKIIGTNENLFDPQADLERKVGFNLDWESLNIRRKQREYQLIEAQPILPGVVEYLETARRLALKTAVASSSSRKWVEGHLERLGLDAYFDLLQTRDDVAKTKPDPELFLSALDRLGVSQEQAVVIEDSLNGVEASCRAGIFTVAVPNPLTTGLPLERADLRIESLAAMPLEQLLSLIISQRNGGRRTEPRGG